MDIEYGAFPQDKMAVSAKIISEDEIFEGKGIFKRIELSLTGAKGTFTFPFTACFPNDGQKNHPSFINIAFGEMPPDSDIPLEYMCGRGFVMMSYYFKDVTADSNEFDTGLIPYFSDQEVISKRKFGKLSVWAYAAMRMLDYAVTLDEIDPERIAIVGHSRLGKTAILAGIMDERFKYVIANDSGCSGAALHRGKQGERIENIMTKYWRWFTENFAEYEGREYDLPFDQHIVMGLVAPRYLYVASGAEDSWSDPMHEFLGAAAASEAYGAYGMVGLVADKIPKTGERFHEGNIGYHVRAGGHAMLYDDWKLMMDFMDLHR